MRRDNSSSPPRITLYSTRQTLLALATTYDPFPHIHYNSGEIKKDTNVRMHIAQALQISKFATKADQLGLSSSICLEVMTERT